MGALVKLAHSWAWGQTFHIRLRGWSPEVTKQALLLCATFCKTVLYTVK